MGTPYEDEKDSSVCMASFMYTPGYPHMTARSVPAIMLIHCTSRIDDLDDCQKLNIGLVVARYKLTMTLKRRGWFSTVLSAHARDITRDILRTSIGAAPIQNAPLGRIRDTSRVLLRHQSTRTYVMGANVVIST